MAVSHATGDRLEDRAAGEPGASNRSRAGEAASERVLDATVACVARWGLGKTTLDDIAREAGVSRATVYRLFPGGKPVLFEQCGRREVARILFELSERLDECASASEVLAQAMHHAATVMAEDRALTMILEREPEVLLPYLAFDRQGPLLASVSAFVAPTLTRFLPRQTAEEAVEWAARLVISYTMTPSESIDLTRLDDARRVVETYLIPGLLAEDPTTFPTPSPC